ncbi:MAG TPA: (Fe-S)-binding protein [Clostridia bacterium]|nr:(Fe-S)-binding protein [Clostridia bacterium]
MDDPGRPNTDTIPSIALEDIDPDKCYFNPGCAMSLYKPEAVEEILHLLNRRFLPTKLHTTCCQHEPNLPAGATIINCCAGCDRRFRSLYKGIQTISLWEVLDAIPALPLPTYDGMQLSVHDSCSFRKKPQVHAAVRSLLDKMHIEVVESQFSGTKSICCGDHFYGRIPLEEVYAFQKKRAAQMPCQEVAVYCASCINSMEIGGKTPHHVLDLVMGEPTGGQERDLDVYHENMARYIEEH